jgi:hypothetical protein
MLSGAERFYNRLKRAITGFATRKAFIHDDQLLNAMLAGLNFGRDNKALVVAREGFVIDVNERMS